MAEPLSLALRRLRLNTTILLFSAAGAYSTRLTLANECSYTVWPGVVSGRGTSSVSTTITSFTLLQGESASIFIPAGPWSGQFWARTLCSYDYTGRFTYLTGDCGIGSAKCASVQIVPPVTVAEFNISGNGRLDLYIVSSSLGYNLGILVVPHGSSGGYCMATGAHALPETCKPSPYSLYLKSRCPYVFGYKYADRRNNTSRFACISADYAITFCPHPSSKVGGLASTVKKGMKFERKRRRSGDGVSGQVAYGGRREGEKNRGEAEGEGGPRPRLGRGERGKGKEENGKTATAVRGRGGTRDGGKKRVKGERGEGRGRGGRGAEAKVAVEGEERERGK
ncbi:hypothetical protein RJ639_021630 [Escallonia herrerae]|uniref:Thaumatin-like protein n=1 Tax=Escallonia herrerae TaxID=1293975 RepID=A0AA88V2D4_9ASTE|nr:hypothetical protein RJ639_021630 [Escallonia herrerae]